MKALLICPSERPQVRALAQDYPLVLTPLLGQSLLEYWLSHLACSGVKEVLLLAHDRPEQVGEVAGDGSRWGLTLAVAEESRELSPAQALLKYAAELDAGPGRTRLAVLDHLPERSEHPLFASYAGWFSELQQWMEQALTPERVGVHETRPGIWQGVGGEVSPEAVLQAPCWLGQHVFVGAGAVVGPNTIVEDGAFVEPGAEVTRSCIGTGTFVGRFARIDGSLAFGNTLVNWQTGSLATVPDSFLLSALRRPHRARSAGWLKWLAESYASEKQEVAGPWKRLIFNKPEGA